MLLTPSKCALTKCLRTNRILDDCPRALYLGWILCLISFVWHQSTCQERVKSKMKNAQELEIKVREECLVLFSMLKATQECASLCYEYLSNIDIFRYVTQNSACIRQNHHCRINTNVYIDIGSTCMFKGHFNRTAGPVPLGTCICSNIETILSWTCHVYGLFEFRTFLGSFILIH